MWLFSLLLHTPFYNGANLAKGTTKVNMISRIAFPIIIVTDCLGCDREWDDLDSAGFDTEHDSQWSTIEMLPNILSC